MSNTAPAENLVLNEVAVGPASDLLDHPSENAVAEVRVGVIRSGRIVERFAVERPSNKLRVVHPQIEKHGIVARVVPTARGVRKEMVNGDFFDPFFVRSFAEFDAENAAAPKNAVVLAKFLAFYERENGRRGDGLGDARNAKKI